MKLLISFCNQPTEFPNKNLVLLDLGSLKKEYLLENEGSFTGLAQDHENYYALSQNKVVRLVVFKKSDNSIVCSHTLKEVTDPHSILVTDTGIYVVSTGTASVLKYRLDPQTMDIEFVETVWTVQQSMGTEGTHHVNSIWGDKRSIYVSAFGEKMGLKWSSAKRGYIVDIGNGRKVIQNIFHPHSLIKKRRKYFFCESATGSIKMNANTLIRSAGEYVRGLSLHKNYLAYGTSGGRTVFKSTGLNNEEAEAGLMRANCKIKVFETRWFSRKYREIVEVDFFPDHVEIYDVMFVE